MPPSFLPPTPLVTDEPPLELASFVSVDSAQPASETTTLMTTASFADANDMP
jgi:hypothetical protein